MKSKIKYGIPGVMVFLFLVFTISCVSVKKIKYFNDIDELQEPAINPRIQKLIMPFDNIYIKVFSIDEKTIQLFNSNNNVASSSSSSLIGYLVDEVGNINFPFTGNLNVIGLTPEQAGNKLGKALSEYVPNAVVNIKFIESKVTVMGEVQSQGVFTFSQDKLNIYEALALGGGISRYGNRKDVILIRQEGDKIMHHKLDLSDSKIAGKDYYYIQANDVIVVEPLKSSAWYNFNNGTFTTILGTFSTILGSITTVMAIIIFSRTL